MHASALRNRRLVNTAFPFVVLALALSLPFFGLPLVALQILTIAALNAILVLGLSISYGSCGIMNFSQGTFAGLGAYTAAIFMTTLKLPFIEALVAGCIVAAFGGILLGLMTIRLGGDAFALVSFAFTVVVSQVFINWSAVTGGINGFAGIPAASMFGMTIVIGRTAFWTTVVALALVALLVSRLAKIDAGRAMLSVRHDVIGAAAVGIDVSRTRLLAIGLGAAVGGVAGAFQVATIGFISPPDFDLVVSFQILLWVIIGGETNVWGLIGTAVLLTGVASAFRGLSDYSAGITGVLVLVMVYMRSGALPGFARSQRRL